MMFFNSIRWRLQIWYGLILLAVLSGFGITAYQLYRNRMLRGVDDELQHRAGVILNAMRQSGRNRGQGDGMRGPQFDGPPPVDAMPFDDPGDGPRPEDQRPPPKFRLPEQQASLFENEGTSGYFYVI